MAVSLYDLAQDTKAVVSRVMSNFTALAQKFTEGANGINDGDISTNAGIKGSKLSNVAGNRIPTDRIEDDAVDATKLRDDATVDGNRAVTTDHIRDAAVTAAKHADASVLYAKVKTSTFTWAVGAVYGPLGTNSITTGKTDTTSIPQAVWLERSGAISAASAVASHGVYKNTATGTYFAFFGNPTSVNQDFTGITLHVEFLEKA